LNEFWRDLEEDKKVAAGVALSFALASFFTLQYLESMKIDLGLGLLGGVGASFREGGVFEEGIMKPKPSATYEEKREEGMDKDWWDHFSPIGTW
jgi:hypothetical protein